MCFLPAVNLVLMKIRQAITNRLSGPGNTVAFLKIVLGNNFESFKPALGVAFPAPQLQRYVFQGG